MPNSSPYPYDPYGSIPNPSNILGGAMPGFALDSGKFNGPYAEAVKSILSILNGPNLPGMAGTQVATQGSDQAAQQYQQSTQQAGADFASRGLTGSGVQQGFTSGALGQLEGGEAAAGQAGTAMTQQMRQQLQQTILNQLQKIGMGRAQAQYGIQSANIGLQSVENAQNSQKLGEFGDIFNTALQIGGPLIGDALGGFGGGAAATALTGSGPAGSMFGTPGGTGGSSGNPMSTMTETNIGPSQAPPTTSWLDPSQMYALGRSYGQYLPSSFLSLGAGA